MRPLLTVNCQLSTLLPVLLALSCARGGPAPAPDGPRPRIVSLIPNATEILFALGAGEHVVGATRYCTRPDAARAVPRVGGILDVSAEAVLAARPDVVVGSPAVLRGRLADLLAESGVRMIPLAFETADSVPAGVRALGDAIGRATEADALASSLAGELAALAGRARRDPPIRVLMVVGRNPLVVAARGSFLGDLLDRMGVVNAAPSTTVPFPTWSMEQVFRAEADVVVDGAVEAGDLGQVLADAGVEAARAGRLVRLDDDAILRPGPGTPAAALRLADRIAAAAGR